MRSLPFFLFASFLACANHAGAFRTAEDAAGFEGAGRVAWPGSAMTYVVHYDTPSGLEFSDFEREVVNAFSTWKAPECAHLVAGSGGISLGTAAPEDGVNSVQWVLLDWTGGGFSSSQAAITDVVYELRDDQWGIVEADLYLNADDYEWITSGRPEGEQVELRSALLHEVGHMLGLLHPCEFDGDDAPSCEGDGFSEAVMHPAYDGAKGALSEDDEAGICYLYPPGECDDESCPEGTTCMNGACRVLCGAEVCAHEETCYAGACHAAEDFCGELLCEDIVTCASDTDCSDGAVCRNGTCGPGDASLGDPCVWDGSCFSGTCADAGYCAAPCSEEVGCNAGFSCRDGACTSEEKGALGDRCGDSGDCLGDECVAGLSPEPLCTRQCGDEFPECPSGWECALVERRLVCTPREHTVYPSGGGTCAIAVRRGDGRGWYASLALLGLVAAMRTRKRWNASKKKRGPQRGRS